MKPDTVEKVLETIKFDGRDSIGEIYFAKFDQTIELYLFEQAEISDYDKECVKTFFKWDNDLFEKLSKASFDYYQDCIEVADLDEELPDIKSFNEIMKFCQPNSLTFNANNKNISDTFVTVELNCDWEIEHGMQWTVKNNDEMVFVGPYDGVSVDYAPKAINNFARKYI